MAKEKTNTTPEKGAPAVSLSFISSDRYVEKHVVSSEETAARGRDFINWGPQNNFPDYLRELYKNVTTLRTIINGCVDYVAGNRIQGVPIMQDGKMNRGEESLRDIVRAGARSFMLYGGISYNVVRAADGRPAEIYIVDMRYIRSNKENTVFYYSEDWRKRWGKTKDLIYPKYERRITEQWAGMDEEARRDHLSTIAYFKAEDSETYPVCPFEPAIKDCEIERMIEEFHLNDLNNGFSASYLLNFLNGLPSEDVKKEIEKEAREKLTGYQNAGRLLLNFATDKEHAATAQRLEASNFEERYNTLAKRSRQQIYAAFRANPNLFGVATESNGFNSEEFQSAFKLFNRTVITPVQIFIAQSLQNIYDCNLAITPFSLETVGEDENTARGGANA